MWNRNQNLKSLTIEGIPFIRLPLPFDPKSPFKLCKLTSLHLRYVDWLRPRENFISKSGAWDHLQDLSIWHGDESEINFTIRRLILDGLPSLRIFSVYLPNANKAEEKPFSLDGIFTLDPETLNTVKPMETVRGVTLANYPLDYRRLTYLAKLFPRTILLEILGQKTTISASDWIKFVENGSLMPFLRALDLPGGNHTAPARNSFEVWGPMSREALRQTCIRRRIALSLHSQQTLHLETIPRRFPIMMYTNQKK